MARPENYMHLLLQAANSSDLPDDISWGTLKFTLKMANIDTTNIDGIGATHLVRNVHRVIEEERADGMRDASREHIGALLDLANDPDIASDVSWLTLKFCLKRSGARVDIPDSADWLRSFTKIRRTIEGEGTEPDHPQKHEPQPPRVESGHSDSTYGSQSAESDLEFVSIFLAGCEKYRNGIASIPYVFSEKNEKHHLHKVAAERWGFPPDQKVVSIRYTFDRDLEPSVALCEVVSDELEADIIFSRKALDAEKRNSLKTHSSSGRHRDHSRSARSSDEYFDDGNQETSHAIGVALQSPAVRNLSEREIANLGTQAEIAIRAARRARGG